MSDDNPRLDLDRSKVLADHDFEGFELRLVDETGERYEFDMSPEALAALRWALTGTEQKVHESDQNDYSYGLTEGL